jgi:hypothetical protein
MKRACAAFALRHNNLNERGLRRLDVFATLSRIGGISMGVVDEDA